MPLKVVHSPLLVQPEGVMALRRWQISEALSYAHLAPLASVYSVVAPPASQRQVRQLASNPTTRVLSQHQVYHWPLQVRPMSSPRL